MRDQSFSTTASATLSWIKQPRARAAHVALVEEDALHDALDRLVERGVLEDDVGRLPAELERERDAAPGERRLDVLADSGGAGEGDLVDVGLAHERRAGHAVARHDRDHARRQLGLLEDLGEQQRGERCGLGRLQHRRVASGERRRQLPGGHQQREVPRHDLAGHAERLDLAPAQRVGELVGPARVVEEVRRRERHVHVARLADRLAAVHRLHDRQLPRPLLDQARDPEQVLAAVEPAERGPARLGGARRLDGAANVAGSGERHLGHRLLGRGIDRLDPGAVRGVAEVAVDEEPVAVAQPHVVGRLRRRRVVPDDARALLLRGHRYSFEKSSGRA